MYKSNVTNTDDVFFGDRVMALVSGQPKKKTDTSFLDFTLQLLTVSINWNYKNIRKEEAFSSIVASECEFSDSGPSY